ncbi:hypothetical protein M9434_000087 [Picochlorum sp. BPE23]|nr:hypothetical protein M9434_000087 [Picochlorum sp. BPE23]
MRGFSSSSSVYACIVAQTKLFFEGVSRQYGTARSLAPTMNIVRMRGHDVETQLHLEEALFRTTRSNWLVVNDGVAVPSIVLGISGKPEVMAHVDDATRMGVPLIKRFTGGGTVVVDKDTVMMSIIVHGERDLPGVERFPRQIMEWCAGFLSGHMSAYGDFALRENDFVIGDRKIGGNAQAISGGRWLHHTSFLFDYRDELMGLLKTPPKAPQYRSNRSHGEFVTRVCDISADREGFVTGIIESVERQGVFKGLHVSEEEAMDVLEKARGRTGAVFGTKRLV